jgi:hypothetical protein
MGKFPVPLYAPIRCLSRVSSYLIYLLVDFLLQLLLHPLPYRFMLIPDTYPLLSFGTVLYLLTVPAGAGVGIPAVKLCRLPLPSHYSLICSLQDTGNCRVQHHTQTGTDHSCLLPSTPAALPLTAGQESGHCCSVPLTTPDS